MRKIFLILSLLIFSCDEPAVDCAGVEGGSAVEDCNGVCEGTASIDDCGTCTGGTTNLEVNYLQDCAGVCNGSSVFDCAGECGGDAVEDCLGVCGGSATLYDCISFPENMIAIDWLIIKNTEFTHRNYEEVTNELYPDGIGEYQMVEYEGVTGYMFIPNSSVSNIYPNYTIVDGQEPDELTTGNFNGTLAFTYNNQEYSYDISDSYHQETEEYVMMGNAFHTSTSIQCDAEMKDYCHIFYPDGLGVLISLSSPFILIDYKYYIESE